MEIGVSVYWVITIMLMFHGTDTIIEREYKAKTFQDDWACHTFIHQEKMELLTQQIMDFGDKLKSFELYCENRYAEEV